MAYPASFVASPKARTAAFVFDGFAALLLFLALAVAAESAQMDIASVAGFAACAWLYNSVLPAVNQGATWGKGAQGILVVSSSGGPAAAWQYVVRSSARFVPAALLSISYTEWVLPQALAGLGIKIGVALFWLGEYALMNSSPTRQTLSDRLAHTLVVNLPPAQSHRAPAGPMFSATDREFGVPPRAPKSSEP